MSKKQGFYSSTDEIKECAECGSMFKTTGTRLELCYKCAKKIKKSHRTEAKTRKWYQSRDDDSDSDSEKT